MAIGTYSQLQTALLDHIHRPELTAQAPDFILMGESRLNRELRMLDMVTTQTGNLSTSLATLALPTRYADKIQFRINDPETELVWVLPSMVKEYAASLTTSRMPRRYTVTDLFEFDAVPDSAYSYTLKYYKGYQLSGSTDTNYLLTNYPQAYLYAAMQHAYIYMGQFDKAQGIGALVRAEIETIKRAESRRKGAQESRLETEFYGRDRFNIDAG